MGTIWDPNTDTEGCAFRHTPHLCPPVAMPCSGSRALGGTCSIPNGGFPSLQWHTSRIQPLGAVRPGGPVHRSLSTPRCGSDPCRHQQAPAATPGPAAPLAVTLLRRRGFLAPLWLATLSEGRCTGVPRAPGLRSPPPSPPL